MIRIDQSSVAIDGLMTFMLKTEFWGDAAEILEWLDHAKKGYDVDDFEYVFYEAAQTYVREARNFYSSEGGDS